MADLNPIVYRKKVIKKLSESDEATEVKKEKIEEKAPLGTPRGTALDQLRSKLFTDETVANREDVGDEYGADEEMGAHAPNVGMGMDSEIDGMDNVDPRDAGYIDPEHALEDEQPSGAMISKEEELQDMASDLVAEVLLQLKDLRDQYKQESPEKAQLVRKLYDYILKGKDKIASELIKAEQDVDTGMQPKQ